MASSLSSADSPSQTKVRAAFSNSFPMRGTSLAFSALFSWSRHMASIHSGLRGSGLHLSRYGKALKRFVLIRKEIPLHDTDFVERSSPQA